MLAHASRSGSRIDPRVSVASRAPRRPTSPRPLQRMNVETFAPIRLSVAREDDARVDETARERSMGARARSRLARRAWARMDGWARGLMTRSRERRLVVVGSSSSSSSRGRTNAPHRNVSSRLFILCATITNERTNEHTHARTHARARARTKDRSPSPGDDVVGF